MKRVQRIKLSQAKELAEKASTELKGGEVLALIGPLGAGKTTFVKYLARHLAIKARVTSPSFTLMHEYSGKIKTPTGSKKIQLYHLDLYRTKSLREVKSLGISEVWTKENTLVLIEWANKILPFLPKQTHFIYFNN